MLSRIHNKLGTAGLIVAIVALVAALGGAAYAASDNHLSGGEKKEVTKIAKKYAGKRGATGPAGPAGANGTNGKDGAKGATGPKGATGETGATGEKGAKGATGPEGSPWTVNGTLPSGKTETGDWGTGIGGFNVLAYSFNIPLASATGYEVKILKEGAEPTTECPGTVAAPKAKAGFVCLYTEGEEGVSFVAPPGFPHVDVSGFRVFANAGAEGAAFGTWAVTAK